MTWYRVTAAAGVFFVTLVGTSVALVSSENSRLAEKPAATDAFSQLPRTPKYAAGIVLATVNTDKIQAESFIAATESGVVLASRNTDAEVPIASLTKIMTALMLKELGGDLTITLTESAKRVTPKISDVPVGEELAANTAKTMLLVESDNDIATAIAETVGQKLRSDNTSAEDVFRRAMNQRARELGLSRTHFRNPTGLDEFGHLSTATDLFRLVQYIDANRPGFWDETASPPKSVTSLSGRKYPIKSSSLLLSHPGIIGIKTGLTDNAEGALVIRYRFTDFTEDIIVVILRSPDRFRDGELLLGAIERAFRRNSK